MELTVFKIVFNNLTVESASKTMTRIISTLRLCASVSLCQEKLRDYEI